MVLRPLRLLGVYVAPPGYRLLITCYPRIQVVGFRSPQVVGYRLQASPDYRFQMSYDLIRVTI